MLQPSHFTPSTGLASLAEASPDYELAPVGLASFQDQAKKLAEFGRNGDIYVVHAAEGETVVPMEVLNENPKVKELLFKQMEDMGLDPQEFIVGSDLNSINPVTGLPEFFVKRIFRSVKKAVKSVAKIVKKAAPIVLPIAAAAFGVPFLGPAFGAGTFGASFLGSGIGTLIGGGSFKDALKAGLISGGTAALASGFTGSQGFFDNVGSTFTGATPVFDAAGTQIGTQYAASPFADALGSSAARQASAAASRAQFDKLFSGDLVGAFTGEGTLFGETPTSVTDPTTGAVKPGFVPTKPITPTTPSIGQASPSAGEFLANRVPGDLGPGVQVASADPAFVPATPTTSTINYAPSQGIPTGTPEINYAGASPIPTGTPNPGGAMLPGPVSPRELTTLEQVQQFTPFAKPVYEVPGQAGQYFVGEAAEGAARKAGMAAAEKALGKYADSPAGIAKIIEAGDKAAAATMPGVAQKYGPTLALGAGAAYLGGAFDAEEVEQPTAGDLEGFVADLGPTGFELFEQDPERYKVANLDPTQFVPTGTPLIPTTFPALLASDGGMAEVPRREMLVEGPGTETSDDIPAMLSDGEFVMNARSVRGADPSGNGNRYAGAKNLYDMMRNFEMRA